MSDRILAAESLVLRYRGLPAPALNDVSLAVRSGVTLGIVGESGSGKSSLARCLLGLERLERGRVTYRGSDLAGMGRGARLAFRRKVQMIFQDPYNSLNPRMTIGAILSEVLRVHGLATERDAGAQVSGLLAMVGLNDDALSRYAHELSGGQRQRIGIARALALQPEVVIADEPVSALDVSVQAHILNLLKDLVDRTGITLVLIAHDLAVVRYVCHRVVVMNQGQVVEEGTVDQVIDQPRDSYTQKLLSAVPAL